MIHSINYISISLLLLTTLQTLAQSRHTVSGTLIDATTNEQLIAATIVVEGTQTGTVTNAYGYFSLTLPAAPVTLRMSYTGYTTLVQQVDLSKQNVNLENIKLKATGLLIKEVVVSASADKLRNHITSTQMGIIDLPMSLLKKVPSIAGEVDIIKALQLTPGVKRGGEGTIGLYVRGGNVDENLILLDEATIYNAGHLLGFFSMFNANALKDVQLYKSSFPTQYGGRLSSIVDVRMKEGNGQHFQAEGSLGLIASNLTLEGPLLKDKASFIISGRRTYIDLVSFNQIPYQFYDLNGKINYRINERNRLYLSGYQGDDKLGLSETEASNNQDDVSVNTSLKLGNATGSLRWNHLFKDPRLFSNFSGQYTRFRYHIAANVGNSSLLIASSIRDWGGKADFSFSPNPQNNLRFGATFTNHYFNPNIVSTTGEISDALKSQPGTQISTNEFALYANNDRQWGHRWQVNGGFRYSGLFVQNKLYTNLEPRLAGRYLINDRHSIKLSYARMAQYMHLVASSSIALPTDLWYPATARIKPGLSDQVSAGYYYTIPAWNIALSLEGYYKWMHNQIEYREGATLLLNNDYEKELITGRGHSYGVEFLATKTAGRFTGWLGYTLSYALRQFDALNGGQAYYARFDRRHDFSLVGAFDLDKKRSIALNVLYATGSPFTGQTSQYITPTPSFTGFDVLPVFGSRNAMRLSPSFRIDLDYAYKISSRKKVKTEVHFSIYNLLNRTQPARVNRTVNSTTGRVEYEQRGLFGIIPTVSFNFKL